MKKLFALILAVIMVMGLATTAYAVSGTNDDTGSITIDGAHIGTTYSIYQILKLESYNTDINSYIYSPVAAWETWIKDASGGGKYLVLNENGTVKWNGTANAHSTAAFVEEAFAYAQANSILPDASMVKTESNTVVFEDLNLGYYLVDSSMGALCSLDTVMPNTSIKEKNTPPGIDKRVKDSQGNWQESISSRIGKTETFATKISVYAGTENLKYHDKMQDTLDYVEGSVKVYYTPMSDGKLVDASNYTVVEPGKTHTDKNGNEYTCTFCVEFKDEFMKTITKATDLTIVYDAVLLPSAVIAGEGNVNDAKLTFGDVGETEWDDAKIYTYQFGIVKTDISNHVLEGAEFDLYYSETGTDQIMLVEEEPTYDGFTPVSGVNYYRPATDAEKAAAGFVSAKIVAGKACIWGIRSHVAMYLEETKEPEGYNKLSERYHITALQDANNNPTFTPEGLYDKGGIEVENLAGAQLPQTGGVGTTLFYIFGGLMVVAAGILLVTKKRMSV